MSHIKPTPEAGLTAEEEREARLLDEQDFPPGSLPMRVWATLDAARAETEVVRRERDAQDTAFDNLRERHVALRALAVDLVEALAAYVDRYPAFRSKPVGAPYSERRAEQEGDIERETVAKATLSRARAQGIGGEREKNDG